MVPVPLTATHHHYPPPAEQLLRLFMRNFALCSPNIPVIIQRITVHRSYFQIASGVSRFSLANLCGEDAGEDSRFVKLCKIKTKK